jgi:threonine dehydratase
MKPIEPLTLDDVRQARNRIAGSVVRTPLIRLQVDAPAQIFLKLETLQPIGSFKLRGALNALRRLPTEALAEGVYTASAGNMAQGVAWGARALGVACTVIMPQSAPQTKLDAVRILGAQIVMLPYDEWWRTLAEHGLAGMRGAFIHPVADRDVMAGNGTIGLEVLEDLPDASAVLVPFGGGGLVAGIGAVVRALAPATKVFGCEVSTATPLRSSLDAGEPVSVSRTASFVDGIGSGGVLPEMWPALQRVLSGALVVPLEEVAKAVRLLVERARIVAEGAGATPVAAALSGRAGVGKLVCVVSGGNIDSRTLIELLS